MGDGFGDQVRLLEYWSLFRLIIVQLSLNPSSLNRAGGQAGPPTAAACAKYHCYSQFPPADLSMPAHSGHRLCR
ncbi:hypothetical protein CV016_18760 [Yersinia kristensenii]|uniref:Uncharacterized protein n=1 Tax=Yersinia kristensenii TaxID=28152 RepID=A0AB73NSD8_YERKR|nr:hypothetical protein CBW52_17215 [Yersinia kristensenii]PHZ35777.1 hypothetical protein CS536_11805 [Yersinia kristensenii]PJG61215.1 hypothetical protein CV016_18760 [Yersinia kristensenii]